MSHKDYTPVDISGNLFREDCIVYRWNEDPEEERTDIGIRTTTSSPS